MKTKDEYIKLLREYKRSHAAKYGISRMGIFGSVAREEQTGKSDIDICFESTPMGLLTFGRIQSELEQLLGCKVDLLRMRKQLDGSCLKESVMEDLIYV